jgi:hypothetical protein
MGFPGPGFTRQLPKQATPLFLPNQSVIQTPHAAVLVDDHLIAYTQ